MRHFPADSHLTDWLEEKGFAFDVITDEDLDRNGLAALSPYDVVLTGTHPEYHTRRTVEALIAYRESGGNLMYLGGNGFYWKIGRNNELPHLIEVRRAEGGMRVWASQPGEYYSSARRRIWWLVAPQWHSTYRKSWASDLRLREASKARTTFGLLPRTGTTSRSSSRAYRQMNASATSDCQEAERPASRSIRQRRTWGRPNLRRL